MANVPPPIKGTKGAPPSASDVTGNLDIAESSELAPLNFKVPPAFRIEFKTYAAQLGISMKELLERSFREYEQNHSRG